jgi:hypothetical protein
MRGFFYHFDVLAIIINAELVGVETLLQRLGYHLFGPFLKNVTLDLYTHNQLHHSLPQVVLVLQQEKLALFDSLRKHHFQLTGRIVVNLI